MRRKRHRGVWQTTQNGQGYSASNFALDPYRLYIPAPPLQPAHGEPPPPIEIKPETPVAAPDSTALELPVPATSEPRSYLHKVRWPGEILSHIAAWYTGTLKNWKAIAKVNSKLASNQNSCRRNNFDPRRSIGHAQTNAPFLRASNGS